MVRQNIDNKRKQKNNAIYHMSLLVLQEMTNLSLPTSDCLDNIKCKTIQSAQKPSISLRYYNSGHEQIVSI